MLERHADVLIRKYDADDETAVDSLYTRVFGESARLLFRRRWNWQFFSNPANESVSSLMWVAEFQGDIAGFLASFPSRFKVLDSDVTIRLPCDLMVSAEARGKGVGEKLIGAYNESEELIVNALHYSLAAGRMYRRLGYREVDSEQLRMRPYDSRPVLLDILSRRWRRKALHSFIPPIVGVIGGVLNLGLKTINHVRAPTCSNKFHIRQFTVSDAGFDELWHRVSSAFPIAAVRNRRWVQWRFLDDPNYDHCLLGAFDHQAKLQGYVDVRVSNKGGLRYGRILDLFCDPGATDLAESLLAAGIEHLDAEGVDMITCLGHLPGLQRAIAKYCYLMPKRLQIPALFCWKGDAKLADAVYDSNRWHLTHADGDDGFSA